MLLVGAPSAPLLNTDFCARAEQYHSPMPINSTVECSRMLVQTGPDLYAACT